MSSSRDSSSSGSPSREASSYTLWEESELARIMAAMGFGTLAEVMTFIGSEAVSTPFVEFVDDFLAVNGEFDDSVLSLDAIVHSIVLDRQQDTPAYTADDPNKSLWTVTNHCARFVVRAYGLAQAIDSHWQGVDEPDFASVAWQLFELLNFLSRRYLATQ